ncbi:KRAB-A domain-containing protein 2-like [Branchiostoma floridae]|uniref:Gypsy retrotransposon integrase-like protein 1 n=1 Tax=Branchiostoma floridae TaxID=7739 RepID=A0A9J7MFC7_BRAFL|nr:KRAB-A domain-containing protein 2-like [Branchiostoma floridae]
MAEEEQQKAEFYRLVEEQINSLGQSKRNSYCLTQERYDKAVQALQLAKGVKCQEGNKFKFWATKHFKLQEIDSKKVLYCKKSSHPVVPKEHIFDAIKCCHTRVGHSRRDKTWEEIKNNYSWVRHDLVQLYLRTCRECATRAPLKKPAAERPVISLGFMTHMQIDIIDMTNRPDRDYRWVLHIQDHFTNYSWTHPLTSTQALEVADKLVQTFCLFGSPRILQSDNGEEFVAEIINELAEKWPGPVIIHGQPYACLPQSWGCIEQANEDLQLKLREWLEEHPDKGWAEGLQHVTYAMNTTVSTTTGRSPYTVVFGQSPHTRYTELTGQGTQYEDDLTDFFTDTGESEQLTQSIEASSNQTADTSTHDPELSNSQQSSTQEFRPLPIKRERDHDHEARIVAAGTETLDRETLHVWDTEQTTPVLAIDQSDMPPGKIRKIDTAETKVKVEPGEPDEAQAVSWFFSNFSKRQ